jgi:hypothetical protein
MAERDSSDPRGPGAAGAPAPDAIPDLEVAPSGGAKPAAAHREPMSVQDMEDFGMEGQPLELALDVGEPVPSRPKLQRKPQAVAAPEPPPPPPPPADASQDGTADAAAAPDVAPPPNAPTATEKWATMVAFLRSVWDEDAPLGLQLVPGIALVAIALLLTLTNLIYSASTGEAISLGPLGAGWIAGLLLLAGIGLIAYRWAKSRR